MKCFKSKKQDLEIDMEVNWKPMELFKNRCNMFSRSNSGNNTSLVRSY